MAEEAPEKHLGVDQRRKRFDPKSRYGGRGGASLVKARAVGDISFEGYSRIYLDVERPRDDEGHVLVSKLDEEIPGLVSGDELPVALAVQLPDLLDAVCVAKKTVRGMQQVVVTTYTVEGTGWMAPSEEERQLMEQRRAARLTLLVDKNNDGRTRQFCKIRDSPLEKITENSLLDNQTRLLGRNGKVGDLAMQAQVFKENVSSCFVARADDKESLLEVDLGADCEVAWVSTQGRFPPVANTDKATGSRVVCETAPTFNNWVSSYELSYRVASGKEWVTLGEFKGNSDMNTEVAHEVSLGKAALTCRYLRFRPLTYNRSPALRVGVYGRRLAGSEAVMQEAVLSGDSFIRYTIHRIKENVNVRRVPVGNGVCRYGCAKCSKNKGGICYGGYGDSSKDRRLRLKAGTVQEVRLLAASVPRGSLSAVDELEDDAADAVADDEAGTAEAGAGGAAGAVVPPPPPPAAPRLARQRSRSNPDLLSSASSVASVDEASTLGSSVEVVGELDIEHYEEDEWVVA